MVLGEGIVYQLINVLISRLDDSVQKARHRHGTVPLSADVPVKVVAKMPHSNDDQMANTLASSEARTFQLQWPRLYYLMLLPNNGVINSFKSI